jgi:hypothetical protein
MAFELPSVLAESKFRCNLRVIEICEVQEQSGFWGKHHNVMSRKLPHKT